MKPFLKSLAATGFGLSLLVSSMARPARAEESDIAVLVMAQSGNSLWTKGIKKAVKAANLPYPNRVFFGVGDTLQRQQELQSAVADLEGRGVHTIYVVPLLISSYSEVARQWRYLLGVDIQAGFMNVPLFPISKHTTIKFMETLNDSTVVVEILLDRIRDISSDPSQETVIIVRRGRE